MTATPWRSASTFDPGWLVADGELIDCLAIARTRKSRRRGLIGRQSFTGLVYFPRTRWIHTLGMRFPIDVGYIDRTGCLIAIRTVEPNAITMPVLSAVGAFESYAGTMSEYGLRIGISVHVLTNAGLVI